MSQYAKPITKPLKGQSIASNLGVFDTLSAKNLKLESINIAGVFEDGVFSNITIENGELINTIIGVNGPTVGYFTDLFIYNNVQFVGQDREDGVIFDPITNTFTINGGLVVRDCSILGNIEICGNTISAKNPNGDINIIPNNIGTVNIRGDFNHNTTFGNFRSRVTNGGVTFDSNNDTSFLSRNGRYTNTSKFGQTLNIQNGDFTINTEIGRGLKNITNVSNTGANLIITFATSHNLKIGDQVSITSGTSDPIFRSNFTVGNILSESVITIPSTVNIISDGFSGSVIKNIDNNINLNAGKHIKIPENITLTFGDTCNNIYGNTSGMYINAKKDLILEVPCDYRTNTVSNYKIEIPRYTKLQFGSSGNHFIDTTSGSLNITSNQTVNVNALLYKNDATNVQYKDPIIRIGNYTENDIKDRGIEFLYNDNTTGSKLGWFGYKNTTGRFTFIKDATNTDEIITGSIGNFELNQLFVNNITLVNGGNLDINCGTIENVNTITGCGNNINILTDENTYLSSSNFYIQSNITRIPNNSLFQFGSIGNLISENTANNLVINGVNNVVVNTKLRGSIIIPSETKVELGVNNIISNTSGEFNINGVNNINLNTTSGSINIPSNTLLKLGNAEMYGGGTGLFVSSLSTNINTINGINATSSVGNIDMITLNGDINLKSSMNVRIPETKSLIFNISGGNNSITGESTGNLVIKGNQNRNINIINNQNINLTASESVKIPYNTKFLFGENADIYINGQTSNGLNVIAPRINLNSATINQSTSNFNITSNNININGGNLIISVDDVKISDPIIKLANGKINDTRDRGIEFNYTTGGNTHLGWFGYKGDTGRFTYLTRATNSNEIVTGVAGEFELGAAIVTDSISFINTGKLNMNCGTISNLNTITGCNGTINIAATSNTYISSSNIYLEASNFVRMPSNIPLQFGSSNITTDTNGNMYLNNNGSLVINSNLQVMGTTTSIYSTVTSVEDPIITLGSIPSGSNINDLKDRGIEFKWNDGISQKLGFFGFDNSSERFVFIKDGINNNEIFSGSVSNVEFSKAFVKNVDIQGGTISNLSTITGTSLNVNVNNMILPYNSPIIFGSTKNSITAGTNDKLIISSGSETIFNNTSGVTLLNNTLLNIGDSSIIQSNGNLNINNSSGNIKLNPIGNIEITTNKNVIYGGFDNRITSDGDQLYLYGFNGISMNATNVSYSGNITVETINGSNVGTSNFDDNLYIMPLGTFQDTFVTSITNISTIGNILVNTLTGHNLKIGDGVKIRFTDTIPKIEGEYIITKVSSNTSYEIIFGGGLTRAGSKGFSRSKLTNYQEKDVGIQVNYWSTTGNQTSTIGTTNFKTGFFGFKLDTERWSFYQNATISNNVVTGSLGNLDINKLFTSRISSFILDGTLNAGSSLITGNNFDINGGQINNTPIGNVIPSTSRFTSISNTVSASLNNVTLQTNLKYSFERLTASATIPVANPNIENVISLLTVNGINYTGASGTLGSLNVPDGTIKKIVCGFIGEGCIYTLHVDNLISPNPKTIKNPSGERSSKMVFKRGGQSCELIFDLVNNKWILIGGNGVYN